MDEARAYRLEPLDTTGVFLGLSAIQCAILGGSIVAGVVLVSAGSAVALPITIIGFGVVVAFGRARGRPLWEWGPVLVEWGLTVAGGRRRWTAPLPLWPSDEPASLPPCLAGLEVVDVEWAGPRPIAAIHDSRRGTLTSLVAAVGPPFVVEPTNEQERLLAAWGDVMGQFAIERSPVADLTWSELARPTDLGSAGSPNRAAPSKEVEAARSSYEDLVRRGAAAAMSHQTVVALTVAQDRLGGGTSEAAPRERLSRALVTATESLMRSLRSAGLTVDAPLTSEEVHDLLRTRVAPHVAEPSSHGRLAERLGHVGCGPAGPLIVETSWDHLTTDGTWHRTWWISSWPRLAVAPTWLEPFLSASGLTRAVTVVVVPIATHASRRRIERDLVKLDSDAATKEQAGRRVDARHRRTTEALLDREQELVAGYPEVAYTGLVTASATSLAELDVQSEILEQLARENGMDVRVLYGRQDAGWAAALPFGLAPSTLLAAQG